MALSIGAGCLCILGFLGDNSIAFALAEVAAEHFCAQGPEV